MENETNPPVLRSSTAEGGRAEKSFLPAEQTVIAPDWTESEWFEVWLKLARREYDHQPSN